MAMIVSTLVLAAAVAPAFIKGKSNTNNFSAAGYSAPNMLVR